MTMPIPSPAALGNVVVDLPTGSDVHPEGRLIRMSSRGLT